ncbi:hypothetical protein [Argonema antarcticum]|uniref:hypothetical protein n=1 Tax=Argonema antarcticum TaxID=2942763 RepID=UPI0020134D14|nr:hypothetical protein [Argonema antarcticum]MCL1472064.1 hypothetical protein [Argonema antarcticum A004/B2]
MYRKVEPVAARAAEFELPNGCKLAEDNRWVMMAQLIPWSFLCFFVSIFPLYSF